MSGVVVAERKDMTADERALNDWIRAYCLGVLAVKRWT